MKCRAQDEVAFLNYEFFKASLHGHYLRTKEKLSIIATEVNSIYDVEHAVVVKTYYKLLKKPKWLKSEYKQVKKSLQELQQLCKRLFCDELLVALERLLLWKYQCILNRGKILETLRNMESNFFEESNHHALNLSAEQQQRFYDYKNRISTKIYIADLNNVSYCMPEEDFEIFLDIIQNLFDTCLAMLHDVFCVLTDPCTSPRKTLSHEQWNQNTRKQKSSSLLTAPFELKMIQNKCKSF